MNTLSAVPISLIIHAAAACDLISLDAKEYSSTAVERICLWNIDQLQRHLKQAPESKTADYNEWSAEIPECGRNKALEDREQY